MNSLQPSAAEVNFRVRPLGFDKGEVQAFISNLLNDYAQVTRELDRLRNEMAALRDYAPERRGPASPVIDVAPVVAQAPAPAAPVSASATTAREVERILAGAERIADEIRARATEESEALRREAETIAATARQRADEQTAEATREAESRAVTLVTDAEARAAATLQSAEAKAAELVRDAESRATELLEHAVQQVSMLDRQATTIRTQCAHMRTAIRAANEAAGAALREIDALDEEPEPALHAKRG